MNHKAVIIICTRPESSRIYRKAFRRLHGVPAIEHILQRVGAHQKTPTENHLPVILAVPERCADYSYLTDQYSATIFFGSPQSPLHRMAEAYKFWLEAHPETTHVVRITHDDILIDEETMMGLVKECVERELGYGITPSIVDGAGVEVIHGANLLAAATATAGDNVEHISYYVRGAANHLPVPTVVRLEPRPAIRRPYRLTMDYEEDAQVLDAALRGPAQGPFPRLDDLCHFLDLNQPVLEHNRLPEYTFYTCAFNSAAWIESAIRSVTPQLNRGEYILVDDASTDGTLAAMLQSAAGDRRFRLLTKAENKGLATCSNEAISKARGRYVIRVDSDDLLLPRAVARMREVMDREMSAIVYANYNEIDETGALIRANVSAQEHHHAGCALMDLKLINEVRFRDGLRHWDGLELINRVRRHFPISYVDEPLWLYRVRKDSMSRTNQRVRARAKENLGLANGPG